ncbi:MAG: hypothetical protein AAFY19_08365 [Pseudomonadota bacterium]
MKPAIAAVFAAGLVMALPAYAQDDAGEVDTLNKIVEIETEQGTIIAQYSGSTRITSRTLGANRAVTRADPYRCAYSVDLEVVRLATLGEEAEARRDLSSSNVIRGMAAGRCSTASADDEIAREIERRNRDLERALENVVRRDRDDVIAEIDAQTVSDSGE